MLQIRIADDADTAELVRLRRIWVQEQDGQEISDPDFDETFSAWQAKNPRTSFLAATDGVVVGMVNLMVFERMPKPGRAPSCWVYLANAFVIPEERNRGVGHQLMEAEITFAQELKAVRMVLSPSELSKNFYARHGFTAAEQLLVREFRS